MSDQDTCLKTTTSLFCFAVKDLIEQLKRGSEEAFQALMAQCSRNVINACYGLLGNVEDAEDVAQDVFIEVYKSIHRFRKESDLNTWIYRIAINKSLDLLRKRKRKKRIGDLRALFHAKAKPADTPHQRLEEMERKVGDRCDQRTGNGGGGTECSAGVAGEWQ